MMCIASLSNKNNGHDRQDDLNKVAARITKTKIVQRLAKPPTYKSQISK